MDCLPVLFFFHVVACLIKFWVLLPQQFTCPALCAKPACRMGTGHTSFEFQYQRFLIVTAIYNEVDLFNSIDTENSTLFFWNGRLFKFNLTLLINKHNFLLIFFIFLLFLGLATQAWSRLQCDEDITDFAIQGWLGEVSTLHNRRTHGPLRSGVFFFFRSY